MTKLTKNEKLLREATSKWSKFLKEGAFKKTLKEFDEDDAYHFDQDKSDNDYTAAGNFKMGDVVKVMNRGSEKDEPEELRCRVGTVVGMDGLDLTLKFENGEEATVKYYNAATNKDYYWSVKGLYKCPEQVSEGGTMGEYGKIDAEDGNPPSKIGRGNAEYMAAYNAVLQARGEEPMDIQQPDQAYLDALRSGQLEERDAGMEAWMEKFKLYARLPQNQPMDEFMKDNAMYAYRQGMSPKRAAEELRSAKLEEQEKEADPRVVAMQQAMDLLEDLQFDSLESALDNMNTEVVRKLSIMIRELDYNRNQVGNIQENEKKKFKVGEFVRIVGGSLKGATGKVIELVTTMKGEQGYVIELYSDAKMKVFGQKGDEVIATADDMESGGTTDGMELYDIDERKNLKEEVAKRVNELLAEGLTPEQIQEKIIEEGIGDFIRKGVDFAKKKTGLGKSAASLKGLRALKIHKDDYFRLKEKFLPTEREIKNYLDFIQNNSRRKGGGIDRDAFDSALGRIRDEALDTLRNPTNFLRAVSKVENKMDDTYDELRSAGRGDKTFQKVRDAYGAILKDMESRRDFVKGLSSAFKEAQRSGDAQAVEDIYNQEVADAKALRARTAMLDKMAKEDEAEKRAKKGVTTKKNPDDSMEFTGGQMSSRSRFAEELSPEDRAHYDSVMNKGKVPNLKGDMGPLPGLEGPFQFRSGAVLYYDPREGKYYDRGKDMYLDNDEAARLTMESNPSSFATRVTHSSDPEMDQVMDIAADMLELGARSRIPVSLVGVESALQKQGFDTKMEKGKLIVDDKYVIAAKDSLPDTAQKISFTKYAADYLSNIEGEQLDLPME